MVIFLLFNNRLLALGSFLYRRFNNILPAAAAASRAAPERSTRHHAQNKIHHPQKHSTWCFTFCFVPHRWPESCLVVWMRVLYKQADTARRGSACRPPEYPSPARLLIRGKWQSEVMSRFFLGVSLLNHLQQQSMSTNLMYWSINFYQVSNKSRVWNFRSWVLNKSYCVNKCHVIWKFITSLTDSSFITVFNIKKT